MSSDTEDKPFLYGLCRPFDGCGDPRTFGCATQSGEPTSSSGTLEEFGNTDDFWQQVNSSVGNPTDKRIDPVAAKQTSGVKLQQPLLVFRQCCALLLLQLGCVYRCLKLLTFDVDITNSLCVTRQHGRRCRTTDLGDSTQRIFLSRIERNTLCFFSRANLGEFSQPLTLGQCQHCTTRCTERTTHRAA